MVHPVMKNQEIPIILSQDILGKPQHGHVLPLEIVSYHIFYHFFQVNGK